MFDGAQVVSPFFKKLFVMIVSNSSLAFISSISLFIIFSSFNNVADTAFSAFDTFIFSFSYMI